MSIVVSDEKKVPAEEQAGVAPHERPVPRISIHVFHVDPDFAATAEQVSSDRRLSKAHMLVSEGGVTAAVEYYKANASPNLLIIETAAQGTAALDELESLAEVCEESTKVLIIGQANDVQLYRKLIRQGVSEYLVAPLTPVQLIETISSLYVNPDDPPIGRIVTFVGARGGAGASMLAHNVGWYIAETLKIDTAILDYDLPFGTAGLDFNQDPGQSIADALAAPERLDDVLLERLLIKCSEHLSIFAAPAMVDRIYDAEDRAYEAVIDQVRESTPCVIVDLPHAWTAWTRQTLLASDEIALVATPDLTSLRNAKNIFDLIRESRPNDAPPRLIINQVGVPKRPEITVKEFAAALDVEPSFVIPFDPHLFGTASNNGQMLIEVQPKSKVSDGVRTLAEVLTGRSVEQVPKKNGISMLPFLTRKAS
nr:MAG: CtpF protein [Hyphomicrobiales bacterium]